MTKETTKPVKGAGSDDASAGFTDDEKAAMQERAREVKAARRGKPTGADGEADLLAKIAAMAEPDRLMAERVHSIVQAAAPGLASKTWYGMPAYAKDGKTICFFQDAAKFKARYATLGFQHDAMLDDGGMWPVAFALVELSPEIEARIAELVKKAAG
jgi:uncharacterized protein YdhG (YjbR/CyaY superfamily)